MGEKMMSLDQEWPRFYRLRFGQSHQPSARNKLIWQDSNDGLLFLKGVYLFVSHVYTSHNWCKCIWSQSIPPPTSFTTSRLIKNRMPTYENLKKKESVMVSMCNLCRIREDYFDNLFLSRPFAKEIWNCLSITFSIHLDTSPLFKPASGL
ncbi:hypothetical protein Lal_00021434 [Lupinus albus]|nr:hypothetical protein Lal_00021434 [Lupinus albus]